MQNPPDMEALTQALSEPSRRAILQSLRYGQKSVTELVEETQRKQPNISNHLARMREQGLVRAERIGRRVYYTLATPFADILLRLHEFTANPLAEDTSSLFPALEMGSLHSAPLRTSARQPTTHGEIPDKKSRAVLSGETPDLADWQDAYRVDILAGQEDRAAALVNTLLSQRVPMETIYTDVFQPVMHRIGEMYRQGDIDEAHEHLASAITERLMGRVAHFYTPVARHTWRALLGCVAGNWHSLGLRMLADGLRIEGWQTLFMGANVPTPSFLSMAETMRPDLIVISCVMEEHLPETIRLTEQMRVLQKENAAWKFLLVVGGHYIQAHPEHLHRLKPDFTAPDMPAFLRTVRAHFTSHREAPETAS